jgi:ribonuclease R
VQKVSRQSYRKPFNDIKCHTAKRGFGFFVELDDYFIEELVKLSSLTDDDYDYYEKEYLIRGRRHGKKFGLGDNVRVRVAKINAFRSEIDFELVEGSSMTNGDNN